MDGLAESNGKVLSDMLLGKEDEKAKNEHLWNSCFASSAVLGTHTIQLIGASQPITSFQDRFYHLFFTKEETEA